jgi:hypothetical protein
LFVFGFVGLFLLLLDGFTVSFPLELEFTLFSDELRAFLSKFFLRLCKFRFKIFLGGAQSFQLGGGCSEG